MADRVPASITIGGSLPADAINAFVEVVRREGLATEWGGEPFDRAELPDRAPLHLMAHEVAWGRFDELEDFCVANGLPFARWSGAYPGEWGAERVVFTGTGAPQCYVADEHDTILMPRCTAERHGNYAAILAHFDAADFAVPPLVIGDPSPPEGERK